MATIFNICEKKTQEIDSTKENNLSYLIASTSIGNSRSQGFVELSILMKLY